MPPRALPDRTALRELMEGFRGRGPRALLLEWKSDLSAEVLSFGTDDKVSDIVVALRRDGAAIVRDGVTPEVMDSLSEEFNSELEEQEPGGDQPLHRDGPPRDHEASL